MKEYVLRNKNILMICTLIVIVIIILFFVSTTYAIVDGTVYTRDELSELIQNQDSSINELDSLINSNYNAYNIYVNNTKVSGLSSASKYVLDSYTCQIGNTTYTESNNVLNWDMGKQQLTQTNILKEQMTCDLYFYSDSHYPMTLVQKIYNDNQKIASRTNFSVAFTENTTGKIYYTSTNTENVCSSANTLTYVSGNGTNSICKTYYFAGVTDNNWVMFANSLWRIVRINEDQSVRLILQRDLNAYHVGQGGRAFIAGGGLGSGDYYRGNENLGFFYPQAITTSLAAAQANTYRNAAANAINHWVDKTLIKNYLSYSSKTAIYCNDRSIYSGLGYGTNATVYKAYNRLVTNKTPQYKCEQVNDRFAVSSTTANGNTNYTNGKLAFGIALIAADELAFSGKVYDVVSPNYLDTINTGWGSWHTMTPMQVTSSFSFSFRAAADKALKSTGSCSSIGIRPVLSLKSCVKYTKGNGTESSPYEVIIDGTCSSAIN